MIVWGIYVIVYQKAQLLLYKNSGENETQYTNPKAANEPLHYNRKTSPFLLYFIFKIFDHINSIIPPVILAFDTLFVILKHP